jgi:lipopolysaccharide transport system permease protein
MGRRCGGEAGAGEIATKPMHSQLKHSTSLFGLFSSLWRNRALIWQMTKREVIARYRGSIMGLAWSFVNPVIMLCMYTFVFSVVFKSRWGTGGDQSKTDFAMILFVGLIIHGLFAECINRAPSLIVSNVSYVKKVVFPLEILPWVAMGSAVFNALVSVFVLLVGFFIVNLYVPWTAIFIFFTILPLVFATVGLAWFLAAMGVFIRDIGQTTGIVTTLVLFVSPVFYPVAALPEKYQKLLLLNPLTFIIEEARDVLIWQRPPDWTVWIIYLSLSLAIAWMGFWWFQKARRGFADVI